MNLLIDLGAIKTGGGVQLATNFLSRLGQNKEKFGRVYLLVADSGPLAKIPLDDLCDGYVYYPNSYAKRKLFELTTLSRFIKYNQIDTIYTFFGAGLPRYPGVRAIVSVAYPIICYPESAYWDFVGFAAGLKKRIVNTLRRSRIRRADKVVVETAVMAKRIEEIVGVEGGRIRIIPPSPSKYVSDREYSEPKGVVKDILLLSGLDPHKNLWRLPAIAESLERLGECHFRFVLSVGKKGFVSSLPSGVNVDEKLLEKYFCFSGAIPAEEIEKVYESSNFLLNISDLESFSNNYMEAWKAGLPLICSDTDFARHICGGSAIYVNQHDPDSAAATIKEILNDVERQRELVGSAKRLLSELPNADEKYQLIQAVLLEEL